MKRLSIFSLLLLACGSGGGGPHGYNVGVGGDMATVVLPGSDMAGQQSPPDMAQPQNGPVDMARHPADMAHAGKAFGCSSDINCYQTNQCADQNCIDACDAMVNTPNGVQLANDLLSCLFVTACPDSGGGVCDSTDMNYDAAACQTCLGNAEMGPCNRQFSACSRDG